MTYNRGRMQNTWVRSSILNDLEPYLHIFGTEWFDYNSLLYVIPLHVDDSCVCYNDISNVISWLSFEIHTQMVHHAWIKLNVYL